MGHEVGPWGAAFAIEEPRQRALALVDLVFGRMLARYGDEWVRKWTGVEVEDLKTDWARTIGHYSRDAIAYGLRFLPERAPNAHQFAAVCMRAPPPPSPRLTAPKADPIRVAEAVTAARGALSQIDSDPLSGARQLRAREQRGERLTMAQREFWRMALAREIATEQAAEP